MGCIMSARNPYHDASSLGAYEADANHRFGYAELHAGERFSPTPRRRLGTMLSAAITITLLSTVGWGLYRTHDIWQPWATAAYDAASAALERTNPSRADVKPPGDPQQVASAETALQATTTLAARDVADAPGREAGAPQPAASPPDTTSPAATAPAEADPSIGGPDAPPVPLPKIAEPTDPLQKRAFAIGLHPDLSRTLLNRLSDADYRNAGIAIRTALAAPSEDEVVIWPRQDRPNLARFEIRFVRGAPADCRRYVVTITKDRWATTAHPMEKCGASLAAARTRAASAD